MPGLGRKIVGAKAIKARRTGKEAEKEKAQSQAKEGQTKPSGK